MKDDDDKAARPSEKPKAKRLVLGKRVIKHLVVKTDVRTGLSAACNATDGACAMTRCCTFP